MKGDDLSNLSPQDAVVAFRSFPRRYAAEVASIEGDDSIEEVAARIGPEGESAAQLVSDVTRTWSILGEALRQILRHDDAVLHPAVTDPAQRHWDAPAPESISEAMVLLGHEADAMAEEVGRVQNAGDWGRTATVAGDGSVTALDVVREAVAAGAGGIARLRATLAAVRR